MQIRWSQNALDSLTDVLDYSLETFGYVQQTVMEEIIMSSTEKLTSFPMMCPVISEISNDLREYRKLVVTKEISLIYWCDEEYVNISFVWDTRRSLHQIFYLFRAENL